MQKRILVREVLPGREQEWKLAEDFVASPERQFVNVLLLVHGMTGARRLACELWLHFLLQGRKARLKPIPPQSEAVDLYHFLNAPSENSQEILILEYDDDRLSPEQSHFFQYLKRDARVLDLPLHNLGPDNAASLTPENFEKSLKKRASELPPDEIEHSTAEIRRRLGRAHCLLGMLDVADRNFGEARNHFEEAHRLLPEPTEQKAEVFKHQAILASEEGQWDEVVAHLRSAEGIYREIGSAEGLFSCALERGNLAFRHRPLEEIEQAYEGALKIAADSGDEHLLARVTHNLGVLACRRGDFVAAFDQLEKARDLFLFFGNTEEQGLNLLQIALAQAFVGRSAEADITFGQAVRLSHSPNFQDRMREVSFEIETAKRGKIPDDRPSPFTFETEPQPWDLEHRWLAAMLKGTAAQAPALRDILHRIYGRLTDPLKLSFEERSDVKQALGPAKGPRAK